MDIESIRKRYEGLGKNRILKDEIRELTNEHHHEMLEKAMIRDFNIEPLIRGEDEIRLRLDEIEGNDIKRNEMEALPEVTRSNKKYDVLKDVDDEYEETLNSLNLPSIMEVIKIDKMENVNDSRDALDKIISITKKLRAENGRNIGLVKTNKKKEDEVKDNRKILDDHMERVKLIRNSSKYKVGSETRGRRGYSQKPSNAYKLDGNKFGILDVDPSKLKEGILEAKLNGKTMYEVVADPDLNDLLTKRFNKKKKYLSHSVSTFNDLVKTGLLPKHSSSLKSKLVGRDVVLMNDREVADRLRLLVGIRGTGNRSLDIRNKITQLSDHLLKREHINEDDYKKSCLKLSNLW